MLGLWNWERFGQVLRKRAASAIRSLSFAKIEQKSSCFTSNPTKPFTISEPQCPLINDVSYKKSVRSADSEVKKIVEGLVGKTLDTFFLCRGGNGKFNWKGNLESSRALDVPTDWVTMFFVPVTGYESLLQFLLNVQVSALTVSTKNRMTWCCTVVNSIFD